MKAIGFAGTAKNTGKTTALTAIAGEAAATGLRLGLTSIGMDGEARDNVTGLPKPRVYAPAGTLVATALPFEAAAGRTPEPLPAPPATMELLSVTPFHSPLGTIAIYRVTEPGLTVLAGPLVAAELRRVLRLMEDAGVDLALVDGAINRLAPMTAVDQMVLSTGAARHENVRVILDEAQALAFLFSLPSRLEGSAAREAITMQRLRRGRAKEDPGSPFPGPVVLTDSDSVAELVAFLQRRRRAQSPFRLVFPSLIAAPALGALAAFLETEVPGELVFPSAAALAVAGPAQDTAAHLLRLKAAGWGLFLSSQVRLAALTVSPYRPAFHQRGSYYVPVQMPEEDYVNLVRELARRSGCPVFDVVRAGPGGLFRRLTQG